MFDGVGVFVTATGTDVGKTLVSRCLVLALARRGLRVAGIKPIETGCAPCPRDAELLARASGAPDLAHGAAWYRAAPPLAPYAVELSTGAAPPDVPAILERASSLAARFDALLVEGAGGLLVPISRATSMADLAREFQLPLLLIADDRLGVLSHVLTAYEAAQQRALEVLAVVLNRCSVSPDPSAGTNLEILRQRLPQPIVEFPHLTSDDDASLAMAAEHSGLAALCNQAFASAAVRSAL
jgi:dethiobiotin synthetase